MRFIFYVLSVIFTAFLLSTIANAQTVEYQVIEPSGATTLSANNKILWENSIVLEAEGQGRGVVYQYKAGAGFVPFGVTEGTVLYEMVFPKTSLDALIVSSNTIGVGTIKDYLVPGIVHQVQGNLANGYDSICYNVVTNWNNVRPWVSCERIVGGTIEYYSKAYWGGYASGYGADKYEALNLKSGFLITDDPNYIASGGVFSSANALTKLKTDPQFKPTLYTHKTSVFPVIGTDTIPSAGASPLIITKIIEPAAVGGVKVVSPSAITGKHYVLRENPIVSTPKPAGGTPTTPQPQHHQQPPPRHPPPPP